MRTAARIAGIFLCVTLLFSGCAQAEEENEVILSSFQASTLDGSSFSQDNIQGYDVTIINFWATFCGPCIREMPDLAEYAQALPENVQLITVCTDGAAELDAAREILQKSGYQGVTLISGDGDLAALVTAIQAVPTTILLDGEGKLCGSPIVGSPEDLAETYTEAVNKALKDQGKAEMELEA